MPRVPTIAIRTDPLLQPAASTYRIATGQSALPHPRPSRPPPFVSGTSRLCSSRAPRQTIASGPDPVKLIGPKDRALSKSGRECAEEAERAVGVGPIVAQGGGDGGPAVRAQQAEEDIAE